MTIQEIIEKTLQDKKFRKQLALSFGKDNEFKIENCSLEEQVFIKFLRKCRWDRTTNRIFKNVDHIIVNKENVTDKVFRHLVKYAKRRNGIWLWVGLTHADLKEQQHAYLRSLPFLDESVFY